MKWKQLLSLNTQAEREKEPKEFDRYPLSGLEKDYKAIISSAQFRRLQDKTQVFPLDQSDFVRTRLTHSIEVSTIAKQLGIMVTNNRTDYLQEDFKSSAEFAEKIPVVLSCAGLLHDLGNPPFGHFGEVVIGEWFKNFFADSRVTYQGIALKKLFADDHPDRQRDLTRMRMDLEHFEGNAQAFRILSKIGKRQESTNINLTSGVLSALVKYPVDSVSFEGKHSKDVKKHKPGYYFSEQEAFTHVSKEAGTLMENGETARHPLAFLVEAADDIAYATADLEDALQKRLFTVNQFIDYFEDEIAKKNSVEETRYASELIRDLKNRLDGAVRDEEHDTIAFSHWMELVRKWLMYVAAFSFSKNYNKIMNGTYRFELMDHTFHTESLRIMKKAMAKFVYWTPEIVKLELSARKIIHGLLDDFIPAVFYLDEETGGLVTTYRQSAVEQKFMNLLPENFKSDYRKAKTGDRVYDLYLRFLMVTDYISGMTDSFARNLYRSINGID